MKDKFAALEKYNFGNGNVPQLGFERKDYTDRIFDYIGNKLIKVLVGQRRAGKSYILRQIAQRLINEGIDAKKLFKFSTETLLRKAFVVTSALFLPVCLLLSALIARYHLFKKNTTCLKIRLN